MNRIAASLAIMLSLAGAVRGAQRGSDLVKAQLLADVSKVKPGQAFTVGVLLRIEPGWHIYWTNPGDSGIVTTVKLKAPAGFSVGQTQYPVPTRIDLPGNLVNYAYEDEVMLLCEVKPPADLKPRRAINLEARVAWLVCKEECLPGSATASLALTAAENSEPSNKDLFAKWESQIPKGRADQVEQSAVSLAQDGSGHIAIHWKKAPGKVELFPGANDALAVSNVKVHTGDDVSSIGFKVQRLAGIELKQQELELVVGYVDSGGQRRGLLLQAPAAQVKVAQGN